MGGDLDRTITYTYRVLNNVSAPTNDAAASQRQLGETMKQTTASSDSQKISFMTQVVAVQALHRGISGINSGLQDLGLLSGNAALMMNKLNSTVQVVAGTFQLFKGITQIIKMWTAAEVSLASVQTYRAVLTNPAKVALAVTGLSVAAGVGGYMLGSRGQGGDTVQQTVNISGLPPSESRSISRDSFEMMGG